MVISGQLSPVEVSFTESLSSDHAALLMTIFPSDSIALMPPPAPSGYKPNKAHHAMWIKTFMTSLLFSALDICKNINSFSCSLVTVLLLHKDSIRSVTIKRDLV